MLTDKLHIKRKHVIDIELLCECAWLCRELLISFNMLNELFLSRPKW